ncbi:NADH-quinone oxidoreductase subunit A [Candidatus Poribacteria bacterium]|nr:MAG: NADH-quinone oxidoreductase subunit A [Candidatus Poribacteria bacterium]
MLFHFANVLIFVIVGCLFVVLNLTVSRLLHTKLFSGEKYIPYECGEDPVGDTRIKFNTRFYVIALIFLIFDVEVVFLLPWAVVFRSIGYIAFLEMLVFIAILLVGLAYVWAKGDLEWIRSTQLEIQSIQREESYDN